MVHKIYLATSWKNRDYERVRGLLLEAKHEVYDFRDPAGAFTWGSLPSPVSPDKWQPEDFLKIINHRECFRGFGRDKEALDWCDTCVLLLPCGNSAHSEYGYAVGRGKRTIVYLQPKLDGTFEPELMYKFTPTPDMVTSDEHLLRRLAR